LNLVFFKVFLQLPYVKKIMRQLIIIILAMAFGVLIGGVTVWVNSYGDYEALTDQNKFLESILSNSGIIISNENNSCEGKPVKTVGAVVASLLEHNRSHKRNTLTYGCYESVCTMSVSDCKPWQERECGSRILKFSVNKQGVIDVSTFSCIDMP
jgi:hypothetical protein